MVRSPKVHLILKGFTKMIKQADKWYQIVLGTVTLVTIAFTFVGEYLAAIWAANCIIWIIANIASEHRIDRLENRVGQQTLNHYAKKN